MKCKFCKFGVHPMKCKCKLTPNLHLDTLQFDQKHVFFQKNVVVFKKTLAIFSKIPLFLKKKQFFPKENVFLRKKTVKHTLPWIDFSMFKPMKLMAEAPQVMQNNWINFFRA